MLRTDQTHEPLETNSQRFVREWQKARTLQDVADACGIEKISATSRAYSYRRRGIPLKRFDSYRHHGRRLNVAGLTRLAKQFAKECA
jgi:hypothetical protein